ncbi:MAG: hypothetical protein MI862_01030 [Desulfobacterales bacterium]|nr:hypothetical protein [Desulfobacterales bacterium]
MEKSTSEFTVNFGSPLDGIDSFIETKKNELLAAVYEDDESGIEQTLSALLNHIRSFDSFSENDEKRINQILAILKRFRTGFSRPFKRKLDPGIRQLKKRVLNQLKTQRHAIRTHHFQDWKKKANLNPDQLKLIFKTAMTFQLTSGCSHFCRRCNEWALPCVRSGFSYPAVCRIIDQMVDQQNREISLYGASDPLDWEDGSNEKKTYTILDLVRYIKKQPLDYFLLSKVPKGKLSLLKKLLKENTNLSISVTSKNKDRITRFQSAVTSPLHKQHDSDELLIPAGLDEDFTTVKPSITDGYGAEITPDGAFIIIPTFTSALYPFGHKKIRVTSQTRFFPEKKTGRHALLVDYFKPLSGYDLNQRVVCLETLMDVQIESVIMDTGQDELTPPGMRSVKEYLKIFDDPARLRRRQMTPAVLKRLKKRFLSQTSFKQLKPDIKKRYMANIRSHFDLCRKEVCTAYKRYAILFFLKAIASYVEKNPLKIKILKFLIQSDIRTVTETDDLPIQASPADAFYDPDTDAFVLFRYCAIKLIQQTDTRRILTLIHNHPVRYDPVTDHFVSSATVSQPRTV